MSVDPDKQGRVAARPGLADLARVDAGHAEQVAIELMRRSAGNWRYGPVRPHMWPHRPVSAKDTALAACYLVTVSDRSRE